jgi:hypothetical protein
MTEWWDCWGRCWPVYTVYVTKMYGADNTELLLECIVQRLQMAVKKGELVNWAENKKDEMSILNISQRFLC